MLFRTMILRSRLSVMLAGIVFLVGMSGIQTQVSGETDKSVNGKLSPQELEKLVGPIALYPDDLVGIVLPASTNTLQVVQATRFLQKRKKDSSLKPNKNWDPSVLGLLNYPEVINMMNEDLEWTQKLGDAVINQQKDVMGAIQKFRAKAETVGNLKSNDKQIIIVEKEVIKIGSWEAWTHNPQAGRKGSGWPCHRQANHVGEGPNEVARRSDSRLRGQGSNKHAAGGTRGPGREKQVDPGFHRCLASHAAVPGQCT